MKIQQDIKVTAYKGLVGLVIDIFTDLEKYLYWH